MRRWKEIRLPPKARARQLVAAMSRAHKTETGESWNDVFARGFYPAGRGLVVQVDGRRYTVVVEPI